MHIQLKFYFHGDVKKPKSLKICVNEQILLNNNMFKVNNKNNATDVAYEFLLLTLNQS